MFEVRCFEYFLVGQCHFRIGRIQLPVFITPVWDIGESYDTIGLFQEVLLNVPEVTFYFNKVSVGMGCFQNNYPRVIQMVWKSKFSDERHSLSLLSHS